LKFGTDIAPATFVSTRIL